MRRLSSVGYVQFKSARWRQHLKRCINFTVHPLQLLQASKIYTYMEHTRGYAGVRFPADERDFSTVSYLTVTGALSPGI
jgi:hypothetical protein